jgi:HK97 family phage portal protein
MPDSLFDLCRAAGHDVFSGPALESKDVIRYSGSTVDAPEWWYQRNGYRRLAQLHGEFSETAALQLSAVVACVKTLGEDVGSLPLHVFSRSSDGESREKDRRHPLYRLLHDAPNPETTAIEFREALTANAALCGNGYARIERSSDGRIIALWQMQPGAVTMDRDKRRQRVYVWKDGNEPEETLSWDRVLHIKGFGIDGIGGLSFMRLARRTLALAREQEDYAADFFNNDKTPGVVLKYAASPKSPEDIPNIRNAWIESIQRHGVAVAHSGVDVEKLGSTNTDAQLNEQRIFELLQVCRYFRMPPHKIAELSRATFSNIEQQQIDYYTGTLRPWLVRWEQAIARCCLSVSERASTYVEHDISGLLRGDFKTQTEGFARLLEKGVLSVNEVRRLLNLNPVEGGSERFIQLNMQSLVNAANGAEVQPDGRQPASAAGRTGLFRL